MTRRPLPRTPGDDPERSDHDEVYPGALPARARHCSGCALRDPVGGAVMLTVSVGRNVGTVPMSGDDWTTLIDRCRDALNVTVGIPDTVHYGTGVWDGIPEESAI